MDAAVLLMSFLVGLLIGVSSMGGAALMAPFLILVLGVRPTLAVQTDLIYGAFTKIVGAGMHLRQGTADTKIAWRMATGSIPGGLLGSLCVVLLPKLGLDIDAQLKRAIGVALVMVAAMLLIRMARGPRLLDIEPYRRHIEGWGIIAWGAVVGFCVGLTSVGSGSLIVPYLLLVFPSPTKVVGTDVFHAAILVSVTGFAHAFNGPIEWRLIATLLTGSIPGVILGTYLVPRLPVTALRAALAILLLVTGIKLV